MNKKTIEDIEVNGKRVLVRVDFNVPQDEGGGINEIKNSTPLLLGAVLILPASENAAIG